MSSTQSSRPQRESEKSGSKQENETKSDDTLDEDEEREEDLYALLNLSKNASREDIKNQYMRLARMLHPDKHRIFIANQEDKKGESGNPEQKTMAGDEEELQNEAQGIFLKVNRAYKILSDDTERKIYDDFGIEGVEVYEKIKASEGVSEEHPSGTGTTTLGRYDKLGENIRQKVLGKVLLHKALEQQERFQQTGTIRTTFDARNMWPFVGDSTTPQVLQMLIYHSLDFPLTEKDILTMTMTAAGSRGQVGYSNFALTQEHTFSELTSVETTVQTSLSNSNALTIKGNRTLTIHTSGALQFDYRDGETGMLIELTRMLTDKMNCVFRLGLGINDGCSLSFDRKNSYIPSLPLRFKHTARKAREEYLNYTRKRTEGIKKNLGNSENYLPEEEFVPPVEPNMTAQQLFNHSTVSLEADSENIGLSCSWLQKFTKNSDATLGLKLSSEDIEVKVGTGRILSPRTKGIFSLGVGLKGVTINFTLRRNRWQYMFPIKLSRTVSLGGVLTAGIVPAIVNYVVLRILRPYTEARQRRLSLEMARKLVRARAAAALQRTVLARVAESVRESEQKAFGLVILCARYGVELHRKYDWRPVAAPSGIEEEQSSRTRSPSDWDEESPENSKSNGQRTTEGARNNEYLEHPRNIDVTDQLQFFVKNSELEIHAQSKSEILGFYNPCHGLNGAAPLLKIRYQLASWVYEITFNDFDPVELPSPRAMLIGNVASQPMVQWENM